MAILGVLTCEVLELEFAYLLSKDSDLERITVLDNPCSERLISSLASRNTKTLRRISSITEFVPGPDLGFEVVIRVLELAHHIRAERLRKVLLNEASHIASSVDAFFLGYGLCGNAFDQPETLFSEAGVPIFIPMDGSYPVDDCVGMIIGGREQYCKELSKVAGTFFMTPGWSYHWRRMLEKEFGDMKLELLRRLFTHYKRTLLIKTPVFSEDEMRQNAEEFNRLFGFYVESCEGTLRILSEAWQSAKAFLKPKGATPEVEQVRKIKPSLKKKF